MMEIKNSKKKACSFTFKYQIVKEEVTASKGKGTDPVDGGTICFDY